MVLVPNNPGSDWTKEKLKLLLESPLNNHPTFAGIEGTESQSTISVADSDFKSIELAYFSQKEEIIAEYLKTVENTWLYICFK